jgi:hypothetical protein
MSNGSGCIQAVPWADASMTSRLRASPHVRLIEVAEAASRPAGQGPAESMPSRLGTTHGVRPIEVAVVASSLPGQGPAASMSSRLGTGQHRHEGVGLSRGRPFSRAEKGELRHTPSVHVCKSRKQNSDSPKKWKWT